MHLSHLDSFFWLSGLVGHSALLGVLLFRCRAREYPLFTAFICFSIVQTIDLYLVYPTSGAYSYVYFYTYWGFSAVNLLLQIGVVYEIASYVFRPLGIWAVDVRHRLLGLIFLSIGLAVALAWLSSPRANEWKEAFAMRASLFSAALFAELFVGMTALSVTAGLPWRTHIARISQGFGIYSIFCILVEAGNSYFGLDNGTAASIILTRVRMMLYVVCLIYWIVTLYQQEPRPKAIPKEIEAYLRLLRTQSGASLDTLRDRNYDE